MWCPQVSQEYDGRFAVRWNFRVRSHFGHSACGPSYAYRSRHSQSRQVASSGNSRMNSTSEYDDSEPFALLGSLRFTFDMPGFSHIPLPRQGDKRRDGYSPSGEPARIAMSQSD